MLYGRCQSTTFVVVLTRITGNGNCKEPQKTAPEIPMMNGSQKSPVFYLVNRGCERLHSKSGSIYFRGEYEIGEKKGS